MFQFTVIRSAHIVIINLAYIFVIINKLILQSVFTTSAFCCDPSQTRTARVQLWQFFWKNCTKLNILSVIAIDLAKIFNKN